MNPLPFSASDIVRPARQKNADGSIEFVCTDCGTVSCLTDTSVRIARGNTSPRSLSGRDVAVQIRAICDACA